MFIISEGEGKMKKTFDNERRASKVTFADDFLSLETVDDYTIKRSHSDTGSWSATRTLSDSSDNVTRTNSNDHSTLRKSPHIQDISNYSSDSASLKSKICNGVSNIKHSLTKKISSKSPEEHNHGCCPSPEIISTGFNGALRSKGRSVIIQKRDQNHNVELDFKGKGKATKSDDYSQVTRFHDSDDTECRFIGSKLYKYDGSRGIFIEADRSNTNEELKNFSSNSDHGIFYSTPNDPKATHSEEIVFAGNNSHDITDTLYES